jgi:hypothetical protein
MKLELFSFNHLTDPELLRRTRDAANSERNVTIRLVALLMELDARRLYLAEGFSSLFIDALDAARHKSKREVELLVASLRPQPDVAATVRKLPAIPPPPSASRLAMPIVDSSAPRYSQCGTTRRCGHRAADTRLRFHHDATKSSSQSKKVRTMSLLFRRNSCVISFPAVTSARFLNAPCSSS